MPFASEIGDEGEFSLGGPVKGLPGGRHLSIPLKGTGHTFDDVGRVCGDARGDDTLAHIVLIRQGEVLRGSDVAQEIGACRCGNRAADGRR